MLNFGENATKAIILHFGVTAKKKLYSIFMGYNITLIGIHN